MYHETFHTGWYHILRWLASHFKIRRSVLNAVLAHWRPQVCCDVQNCVPFNVLILPVPPGSPVGNYALYIEAETAVLQATSASVSNGTLQLQLLKTVSTQLPVKITVCSFYSLNQFDHRAVLSLQCTDFRPSVTQIVFRASIHRMHLCTTSACWRSIEFPGLALVYMLMQDSELMQTCGKIVYRAHDEEAIICRFTCQEASSSQLPAHLELGSSLWALDSVHLLWMSIRPSALAMSTSSIWLQPRSILQAPGESSMQIWTCYRTASKLLSSSRDYILSLMCDRISIDLNQDSCINEIKVKSLH